MTNPGSLSRLIFAMSAVASLALVGCSGMMTSFGAGMPEELIQKGVSAPAEIVEVWDTGWTINDNPVVGLKVHVQPSDRAPFEATIAKTAISRIAVPRFQPGQTIMVRFDPNDPRLIAVDPGGPAPSAPSTGNPYKDQYVRANVLGATLLRPPEEPQMYLGTADSGADMQALYENGYVLIGASGVHGAPDPGMALDQGKAAGAALVVVYGRFVRPPGITLEVLPYRPRPALADEPSAAQTGPAPVVKNLGVDDQAATYWGKSRPAILGIVSRPLNVTEQKRLSRTDGIVVESVANGSPASTAGIRPGDVVVAIEGKPLPDVRAVPELITSLAGKRVQVELIRGERPLSVVVALNPASP